MQGHRDIIDAIKRMEDIPPLPSVVFEVLKLAYSNDSSIRDVEKVLTHDSVLTAKILKVANSAYYAMGREVTSIHRALLLLGMEEVASIVTSAVLIEQLSFSADFFDCRRFWNHSAMVGEIAKLFASSINEFFEKKIIEEDMISVLFTAGILHDIGKIIVARYFPDLYMKSVYLARGKNIPLYLAERQVMGVDHAEVGYEIGKRWNLPDILKNAIFAHHELERVDEKYRKIGAVIRISDNLAISSGMMAEEKLNYMIDLEDDESWEYLKEWAGMDEWDIETFLFAVRDKLDNIKEYVIALGG